ncbi:MAG: hypothetical protein HZB75_02265 [Candidatus Saccharibacteria bacterium]|nr:MAG: hypothetical protein HZB75_02265 [Candidatus Saccharibacteria bacterium]
MEKILYIGGIGSSSHSVETVAAALSAQFKLNVIAMSFSMACSQRARVAQLARESLVITHSEGILALKDTAPMELVAVAPPMPSHPLLLIGRAFPKTFALLLSGRESYERPRKLIDYHARLLLEHGLHPRYNSMMIREVASFDVARFAVEVTMTGGKVTLGFMEHDLLFPGAHLHPHIEVAKERGVKVFENIIGQHDEFALYPVDVMAQMQRLVK